MGNTEKNELMLNSEAFTKELPDLSKAVAAPLPINGEYWSPEKEGETKRMFFKELRTELVIDQQSGREVELLVAYFVEVKDGGKRSIIRQGGRRLTAVFESYVSAGTITSGMPFEITYLGKQKNKSNQNFSDTWSITPLATK